MLLGRKRSPNKLIFLPKGVKSLFYRPPAHPPGFREMKVMLLCEVEVLEMVSTVSQTVILKVTFAPSQGIVLLMLFGYSCGIE